MAVPLIVRAATPSCYPPTHSTPCTAGIKSFPCAPDETCVDGVCKVCAPGRPQGSVTKQLWPGMPGGGEAPAG
jgi:hypothetical protein